MSTKRESAVIVGVGAAACAACCAGPVLGFLAAVGLTTAVGAMWLGSSGLLLAALVVALLVRRRRGRAASCSVDATPVPVELTRSRATGDGSVVSTQYCVAAADFAVISGTNRTPSAVERS